MIDFSLSEENRLVSQSVRGFADAEIAPHIREWDAAGEVHLTRAVAEESIQKKAVVYDHDEDGHYDTI